jgi:hypothetical protein
MSAEQLSPGKSRLPAPNHVNAKGRLEAVTFLGTRFMLVLVSACAVRERRATQGWIVAGERRQRVSGSRISLGRGDSIEQPTLLLLRPHGRKHPRLGALLLECGDQAAALEPRIAEAVMSPENFVSQLTTLGVTPPVTLLDQIIAVLGRTAGALPDAVSSLSAIRHSMRERSSLQRIDSDDDFEAHVDGLWRVDRRCFYVKGWLLDRTSRLKHLRLVTPEGRRVDVLERAFRFPRPNLSQSRGVAPSAKLGFAAFVELPENSVPRSGWTLDAELIDGTSEIDAPLVIDNAVELRAELAADVGLDWSPSRPLLAEHILPATTHLQKRLSEEIGIDTLEQHGTPPASPQVTIIVRLSSGTEFLEHQLAQFVHDPEILSTDLIYVPSAPEDGQRLRRVAEQLCELYRVPLRFVTLNGDGGRSLTLNATATLARGRLLLLLDEDVLPGNAGWLSRMVEFYDTHPRTGAIAPKLLYEDGSIQHAGIRFSRFPDAWWLNEPMYKGMHRLFAQANLTRRVPAISSACLLLSTELFRATGGLRGTYFATGDESEDSYEDSDLCLRLQEHGKECWYLPAVELYHLEAGTPSGAAIENAAEYNRWLHTRLWSSAGTAITEQSAGGYGRDGSRHES